MFCTKCGKELEDGEICDCKKSVNEENQNTQNEQYASQSTYYQPPTQNEQNQYANAQNQGNQGYVQFTTDGYPVNYIPRERKIAAILAGAFPVFGIYNFYLGNKDKAIIQLIVALLGGCFFGAGLVAVFIWSLVEMVQILTGQINIDGNGFKIKE